MKPVRLALAAVLAALTLSACIVRVPGPVVRGPPCPGGVWIEGHHNVRGNWVPAHWRCPGVVVEVD